MHQGAAPMSDNPAPRRDGASPITWAEILAVLAAEAGNSDRWLTRLTEELAQGAGDTSAAVLQSAIDQHERRAEVFSAAWRFIWHMRSDRRMRERLSELTAAERGGDIEADQVRYE